MPTWADIGRFWDDLTPAQRLEHVVWAFDCETENVLADFVSGLTWASLPERVGEWIGYESYLGDDVFNKMNDDDAPPSYPPPVR